VPAPTYWGDREDEAPDAVPPLAFGIEKEKLKLREELLITGVVAPTPEEAPGASAEPEPEPPPQPVARSIPATAVTVRIRGITNGPFTKEARL
jgi:hypothetical protein